MVKTIMSTAAFFRFCFVTTPSFQRNQQRPKCILSKLYHRIISFALFFLASTVNLKPFKKKIIENLFQAPCYGEGKAYLKPLLNELVENRPNAYFPGGFRQAHSTRKIPEIPINDSPHENREPLGKKKYLSLKMPHLYDLKTSL